MASLKTSPGKPAFRGLMPNGAPADKKHVFWWFERNGNYLRCEILELGSGTFELRVVDANGSERVEQFADASDLAKRQQAVVQELTGEGWTGPHGWVL